MNTETISFRPRNGLSAECYWKMRRWCTQHGFAVSDVFNSIVIPLSYYLENYCKIEPEKSMATVELNIGFLPILHVFGGRCYSLLEDTNNPRRRAFTLEEIQERIDYWENRNAETPEIYDTMLRQEESGAVV